jgi:hypothetical protein
VSSCSSVRSEMGIHSWQSIAKAIKKTWKDEGLSGLYSGLSSSLLGIVVTNGVYYGFCTATSLIPT